MVSMAVLPLDGGRPVTKSREDVGPRTTGDRQRAKQSRPRFVGCLAACTGGTCGDEGPGVPVYGRPPEKVLHQSQGAGDLGMTSQPRRMTPLQNVRTNCIRNEQPTGRTSTRIGMVSLVLGDQGLELSPTRNTSRPRSANGTRRSAWCCGNLGYNFL